MSISVADFPPGTENNLPMRIGCYVLFALCTIPVLLRIYVRTFRSRKIGLDDGFVLAAWVSEIVVIVSVKLQFDSGIGWHASDLMKLPNGAELLSRMVLWPWVAQFLYFFQLGCIKSSVVSLYIRLAVTPMQVRILWITLIIIFGQGLSSSLVVAGFICRPLSIVWDSSQGQFGGPQCMNILAFNYYNAAFFILSDLFLVVAPILVWTSYCGSQIQVALSVMFSLGSLAIGGTIARQVTNAIAINNTSDFTWYWAAAELSSVLESSLGIVFICVPAVAPLFGTMRGSPSKESEEGIDLEDPKCPATFGKLGRQTRAQPGDETLLHETQITISSNDSDVAFQNSICETDGCASHSQ
ncbi:hypothetical protein JX266_006369 [Neoarthrinium moseri]|uniref:uncharacterized protein n=1 Tax=Neoarthrinium moseri TaxID=1658444 RepID=UPI001FDDECFA|nr:uncharacterized protein JN550_007126 [Neoarthrinium moseri]KAI1847517.1 hypothetical protein JX266_006369 [Neoarthrinium moseri]KAI1867395.1 hypothetical protein JN550_007126 [Neoarthrinium moseri]